MIDAAEGGINGYEGLEEAVGVLPSLFTHFAYILRLSEKV